MRKYYPGITLYKLLGSFFVVLMHTKMPLFYTNLNETIAGLHNFLAIVVPVFYVISGFLAHKGWSHAKNPSHYVRKYLTWILCVYILFFVFYFAKNVAPLLVHYGLVPHLLLQLLKDLLQKFFDKGPSPALWFVPPLLFGVAAAYYFDKKSRYKPAIVLALAGFIISQFTWGTLRVATESYTGKLLFYNISYVDEITRLIMKYFAYGFTFVLTGVIISKYEDAFLKLKSSWLWITALLFAVAEGWYINTQISGAYPYLMVISMLPLTILAFYGILHIKWQSVQAYHKFLNTLSVLVFFCHIYFIHINMALLGFKQQTITTPQTLFCILLTFAEASVLTMLLFAFQRKLNTPIKKILSFA